MLQKMTKNALSGYNKIVLNFTLACDYWDGWRTPVTMSGMLGMDRQTLRFLRNAVEGDGMPAATSGRVIHTLCACLIRRSSSNGVGGLQRKGRGK